MVQRGQSTLEWVIGAAVILGTLISNGTFHPIHRAQVQNLTTRPVFVVASGWNPLG